MKGVRASAGKLLEPWFGRTGRKERARASALSLACSPPCSEWIQARWFAAVTTFFGLTASPAAGLANACMSAKAVRLPRNRCNSSVAVPDAGPKGVTRRAGECITPVASPGGASQGTL